MTDEELKELVASLAIAQKHTDEQISELSVSQKRTDEQMRKTDEQIAELKDAVKETNETLKRIGVDFGNMKKIKAMWLRNFSSIACLMTRIWVESILTILQKASPNIVVTCRKNTTL